jgi:hypothetical protein
VTRGGVKYRNCQCAGCGRWVRMRLVFEPPKFQ